jgi:WhiB family redox-sensing transcriptional regulator
MYATITDNRLDLDSRLESELDIEQTFNELVAPVEVRAPQARCADGNGTLTHLFFADDPLSTARAKAICSKCKLAESCLEGALARAEPWGVWGGEVFVGGVVVATKRGRGRPRKNAAPAA